MLGSRLVGPRRPQINRLLPGYDGKTLGAGVGRQTDAPPTPEPPLQYLPDGGPGQEFHTLLTMWLLSAGSPVPINKNSSFLVLLSPLHTSLPLFFFLSFTEVSVG